MAYSAIVIHVEKDKGIGDLLAIARAETMKKHGLKREKVDILEFIYVQRLDVYVTLYKAPEVRGRRMKNEG